MKSTKLFTKAEIAEILGISLRTLQRWIADTPDLHVPRGLIRPAQVDEIFDKLGFPELIGIHKK